MIEPARETASSESIKVPTQDLSITMRPVTVNLEHDTIHTMDSIPKVSLSEVKTTADSLQAREPEKVNKGNPPEIEIFETKESSSKTAGPQTIAPPSLVSAPASVQSSTSQEPKDASSQKPAPNTEPERPFRSFLKKADDFIERNLVNFKKLLA